VDLEVEVAGRDRRLVLPTKLITSPAFTCAPFLRERREGGEMGV
jgi:hypothetical protein